MSPATDKLLQILESGGKSADFAVSGSFSVVLPGLDVKGVGPVGLPVNPSVARELIEHADQAPYGQGEQTIVDTKVRRVWQIDPQEIKIGNPDWDLQMAALVATVAHELGIMREVTYDFYKLLVYEKGCFFKPHRDTEKQQGMFATLVVCLPSKHRGGKLIVRHDGKSQQFDLSEPEEQYRIQYVAFYADCEHEIQRVTSGYRVCLIYNLSLIDSPAQPTAPHYADGVSQLVDILPEVLHDPLSPRDKLVIPLEHQYSEAGLCFAGLKGADRVHAEMLTQAAGQLDYEVCLALVDGRQSGGLDDATPGYDGWDYQGNDEDAIMDEVYDEEWSLSHWSDQIGVRPDLGRLSLFPEDLPYPEGFDALPMQQTVFAYTGNEGVSMNRWYQQGALVVWQPQARFSILAREGQKTALPALMELIKQEKRPARYSVCKEFAAKIIDFWRGVNQRSRWAERGGSRQMLQCLTQLADLPLGSRFVREVLVQDCSGGEGPALRKLCVRLGWEAMAEVLSFFVNTQGPENKQAEPVHLVSIYQGLCSAAGEMTAERRRVCTSLASDVLKILRQWDQPSEKLPYAQANKPREGVVEGLFHAFAGIDQPTLLEQFLRDAVNDPKRYSLHEVLIPASLRIDPKSAHNQKLKACGKTLINHCIAQLEERTAQPVKFPSDWSREANLRCNCADCQELAEFLRDPRECVYRFSAAAYRRGHLSHQILMGHLDVDEQTERRGSPHTLVLTKNRASYQLEKTQFEKKVRLLRELRRKLKTLR